MKPFEIQGADFKLGGVTLQAGTTGVVIPGVTRAATYRAEEVEDNGDDSNTWQETPVVIDQETYNRLAGIITLNDGWSAPTYSVELDDEGKIDGIEVEDGGIIPSIEITSHMEDNMLAAPAGSSTDPNTFDINVWVAIPYYVKCRAGEVETIGGGGGADTGDITFDGVNIIGTGSGDYPGLIKLTPNDNSSYTEAGQFLEIYPTRGQDAPHIHIAAGSGGDLMLGNDMSYVDVNHDGSVKVQTYNGENTPTQWQFKTNGDLQLPSGGDIVDSTGASVLGGTGGGISFNEAGGLEFPDGSIQTTAYVTAQQLGYFTELVHTSDGNNLRGEAVAMDSDGNSYVSYTYYDQNDDRNYGGVMKFNSAGAKLWSTQLLSQNSNAEYVQIVSLEYILMGSDYALVAFGKYYDNNTSKYVGIMYYINPTDGSIGSSLIDGEITSTNGIRLSDGVVGIDGDGPYAVMVGETYNEVLQKTFTPLAPSTTDKLYVSWSEFNASGMLPGENLTYTTGGYYTVKMNGVDTLASPDGIGEGISVTVSAVEGGTYNITRVNGWSGAIYGWSVPVKLRVLGSNLGGVDNVKYTVTSDAISTGNFLYFEAALFPDLANVQDGWVATGPGINGSVTLSNVQQAGGYYRFDAPVGVTVSPSATYTIISNTGNDFTFDFNNTVFADNSSNITAAVSNKQGTPISDVYCQTYNGKDWSADIGTTLTFNYELNNQAYIARIGGVTWSKSVGVTNYDRLTSVVVDSSYNIYAVGYIYDNNRGAAVIKYDVSGVEQWAVYVDANNRMGNEVNSIDLLADGNIIVCDEDGTVSKLNSETGEIIWQIETDSGPSWDANFRGTATPNGNYIFANYEDNDYTMYVICISGEDGSSVWTKQITRTFGGNNGEIIPEDDFNAQYIDCNDTHVTIAATTNLNSVYAGLVFNFPIDGQGIDGTYGQYVISSQSLSLDTQSTTSVAITLVELTSTATLTPISPTASGADVTVTKTNIGGGTETAAPVKGIERHSLNQGDNNITLAEEHNGKFLYYNGSNGNSWIYVPSNSDDALPIGFTVTVIMDYFNYNRIYVNNNTGSGNATLNASGFQYGTTNTWVFGATADKCGVYTIMKVDTDRWMLAGPDVQVG